MKQARRILAAAVVAAAMAGCSANAPELGEAPQKAKKTRNADAGAKPKAEETVALNAQEVRSALAGNSIYATGTDLKFAALHNADGTLKGKAWTGESTDTGTGAWKIDEKGQYCRKWDNAWAGGEWGCFKVYRQGDALMMERVSGAGANGKRNIVPGNAYGL